MSITDKSLLIVGNFHSHPSSEAFLRKFLKIIINISENIILISGDLPSEFADNAKWFKISNNVGSKPFASSRFLIYIYNQFYAISLIYHISKLTNTETIIFLSPQPISMSFAKMIGKKILLHQGGSYSKQNSFNNILSRFIFSFIFENLPWAIADLIIIKSPSAIEFQGMQSFEGKIAIAPLCVNFSKFTYNTPINDRNLRIGFISSLIELKGPDLFVKAMIILTTYILKNNIEIFIGGDGPLLESIKESISNSEISDRFIYAGWVPHQDLPGYLNGLRLLVLPSHSEGMPNIILESMSCGTPVLATPVGSIPDIIKDEVTGFIMSNNLPETISKNIIRAIEYPYLEYIVDNAINMVHTEFTYKAAVQKWKIILEK